MQSPNYKNDFFSYFQLVSVILIFIFFENLIIHLNGCSCPVRTFMSQTKFYISDTTGWWYSIYFRHCLNNIFFATFMRFFRFELVSELVRFLYLLIL